MSTIDITNAMKRALDFAIMHHTDAGYTEVRYAVQSALREALEQPSGEATLAQQEPVAWRIRCTDPMRDWVLMYRHPRTEEQFSNIEIQPLYTSPPYEAAPLAQVAEPRKRKQLTDDDLDDITVAARNGNLYDLRCVIEAKLKEH